MKSIFNIFVFLLCFHYCQADFCQYNFSLSDLESSYIEEVFDYIVHGVLHVCDDTEVEDSRINFWLYTRESQDGNPLDLVDPAVTLKQQKTVVLIPGWLCNITNDLMPELKDSYLQKYDSNVIIVDWSYYAKNTYGDAYCRCANIGKVIANFLLKLHTESKIIIEQTHILGHSMGGQLAGIIGYNLKTNNRVLQRITGLDPAGPLFLFDRESDRLNSDDAYFVDVIHTNAYWLGYAYRCGDVDFYPGCGMSQNGCRADMSEFFDPLEFLVEKMSCDHLRSVDYMIESLHINKFKSKSQYVLCAFEGGIISYMGEDSISSPKDNIYKCNTNYTKPFGLG